MQYFKMKRFNVTFYKVLWRNMLPIKPGKPERSPFSFDKALGSLTCVTQHTEPTACDITRFSSHARKASTLGLKSALT